MDKQIVKAKKQYTNDLAVLTKKSNMFSYIRLAIFILIVIFLCLMFESRNGFFMVCVYILTAVFFVIVFAHYFIDTKKDNIMGYLSIIDEYEMRLDNRWKEFDSHLETSIDYINDLNLIGKSSLFEYINMTRTLGGRKRLFNTFKLKNVDKEDIKKKQEQIEEITKNFNFILDTLSRLNDTNSFYETDFKEYLYLLDTKMKYSYIPLIISLLISITAMATLILGIIDYRYIGFFVLIMLVQTCYANLYARHRAKYYQDIFTCTKKFSKLKEIYSYLSQVEFKTERNKELIQKIKKGNKVVMIIYSISGLDSFRNNFITSVLFNTLFSLNFIIILLYKKLLENKVTNFKESISALEEIETMISFATVGYVKKNTCFPKIVDKISLNFKNVRHPLLEEKECVPNTFKTGEEINIITGSNMSGKTSFMKTIGVNLILAYNGSYVNADEFTCSIMNIFTSINVKDDISRGISTFYGELLRIKNILDYSEKNSEPLVIFIDEIFKGTNYNDRIIGAKETLKKLAKLNCIVFLTTHDFELCEIKEKKINNYHFSENYNKNKISFDYIIKEGKCKTTNAIYLMKQVHIIDN